MPIWDIQGVDKITGEERSFFLKAEDEESAMRAANENNVLVSSIKKRQPQDFQPFQPDLTWHQKPLNENDPSLIFDLSRKPTAGDTERYLLGIGYLLRKIHFWILVWSVLSLLGGILGIIAMIVQAHNAEAK